MTPARREGLTALGVAALTALVFHCAPPARFLSWDDAANLLDQDRWRGFSLDSLRWMLTTRHYGPWQPLSWLSWAVDHALWGLDAGAMRRTNILLHSLAAGLAVPVASRLLERLSPGASATARLRGAFFAALFFSVHPLRVESVVWITERRDVLSGLFVLASLLAWLEGKRRWSLVAFTLAVLSKGTAVAALAFLFVLERDRRALLGHVAVAAAAAAMNLWGLASGDLRAYALTPWQRLELSLHAAFFYPSKTLLPLGLSPYYALPRDFSSLHASALAGLVVSVAALASRLAPFWAAFLLAVAPVSGLLQNGGQAAADRYSYLACLPFALLAGLAAVRARSLLLAVPLLWWLTARQASYWRDDASLWTRAVAIEPDAYLPRSNLALALHAEKRLSEAAAQYEAAIRLEPRDAEARVNLGAIRAGQGDLETAERLYREAVAIKPGSASARFNLGGVLLARGRKDEGLARLREALSLDPSLAARLPRGVKP